MDAALGNIGQALLDNHEPLDSATVITYFDSSALVSEMYSAVDGADDAKVKAKLDQ